MKRHIDSYIDSKYRAWSPTTLKSTKSKLYAFFKRTDGNYLNAENTYELLSLYLKPYSIKTMFVLLIGFYEFMEHGLAPKLKKFMKDNARLFKHVYVKKRLNITYAEAKQCILLLPHTSYRLKALQLLNTGMRWGESLTLADDGMVVGKGAKARKVFAFSSEDLSKVNYNGFYKYLKRHTGLTPHDLRKLAATEAARRGAQAADLLEIFGWSSIATASSYLQPEREEKLKEFVG